MRGKRKACEDTAGGRHGRDAARRPRQHGPGGALDRGLGGTPLLELYLVFGEVAALLKDRGVAIARNLVGNYVTSLDMAGMSVTVCKADDEILRLWDAPVRTPALRWGC